MRHLTDNELQACLHELGPNERTRIQSHLDTCRECLKQLLIYQSLGDLFTRALSRHTPVDIEASVLKRLKSVRRLRRMTDVVVAAAAFVGLALVGAAVLLTPPLNEIVSGYLIDALRSDNQLAGAVGKMPEVSAVLLFAVILFVLFAMIDHLAVKRLSPAAGSGPRHNADEI